MKTLILCTALFTSAAFAASTADLIKQGDAHDQRFQPDEALKYYLPAEQASPDDATLLVKIARQYAFRMDDLDARADKFAAAKTALTYAERAVKAAPGECDPHLSVAIVLGKMSPLMSTREQVEASRRIKESADKAVKFNPRNDYAWHLLGRWHQAMADLGALKRSVAQLVYGSLPAASNEEAVKCFEKAIALNSSRLVHHIELGRTYAQMGRTEEARAAISKGLSMPSREKDDPASKARGKAALDKL